MFNLFTNCRSIICFNTIIIKTKLKSQMECEITVATLTAMYHTSFYEFK